MQRENEHQHEKEKICPRSLARRAVEAEPQIDYLKGSDQGPQAYEDAKDQRNCRQQFEEVDDRREQVECGKTMLLTKSA